MSDTPVPPVSPGDENPASELKSDVVDDVRREDTITGDLVGDDDTEDPDDAGPDADVDGFQI